MVSAMETGPDWVSMDRRPNTIAETRRLDSSLRTT